MSILSLTPSDERAQRALAAVLPVGASLRRSGNTVTVNGQAVELIWTDDAWPSEVARILAVKRPTDAPPRLLVARTLPSTSRALAEENGAGWLEESGAASIELPGLVIVRDARHVAPRHGRWTPATLAIVEAVLADGIKTTVSETTRATGLSPRTCALALSTLTDEGLLSAKAARGPKAARFVPDPGRLLEAYCRAYADLRSPIEVSGGVGREDLDGFLRKIGTASPEPRHTWAVTGQYAAQAYAPFLTRVGRAVVLVDAKTPAELDSVLRHWRVRPIEGGRLILRPFVSRGDGRRVRTLNGLPLAPWPSVVADAREEGVRGEEAADHLREIMLDVHRG